MARGLLDGKRGILCFWFKILRNYSCFFFILLVFSQCVLQCVTHLLARIDLHINLYN